MRRLAALLLAATLTVPLAGCGQESDVAGTATPSGGSTSATGLTAERAFLAATAAHLCDVQSDVFEDPAELAAAYALVPEYQGLSDDEVADLTARLAEDPTFSEELREKIAATCG